MGKLIDLTGRRFGRLVVIRRGNKPENVKNRDIYWLCQCDCGNEIVTSGASLKNGKTKSCGCLKIQKFEKNRKRNFKDISGKRFGKLLVLSIAEKPENVKCQNTYWLCQCDCGNTKIIVSNSIISGITSSCGCEHKKIVNDRNSNGQASFRSIFNLYKRNAKNRNINFNLSIDEFKEITQKNCYYCNVSPKQFSSNYIQYGLYIYNGIDRIDSNKGYEIDNVVPCCGVCNRAKLAMPLDEFILWIKNLCEYSINIGRIKI